MKRNDEAVRRIYYYTRKVAEYGDRSKPRKANRGERLLAYKAAMHRRIR